MSEIEQGPGGGEIAELRINSDLERNLRALTADESEELEQGILTEGCRDPIVVWREENSILDGHNRFRICKKHGIPFKVVYVGLPSLEAALAWQVRNQFAKRNLTPAEIAYLRGREYLSVKQAHGGDRRGGSSGQNDHLKSGEQVAARHGVGEKTVRRDAAFTDAVDVMASALGDDVRTRILTGDTPLSKQDVVTLARVVANEPEIGKEAAELFFGEEPDDFLSRINPHGVRDPEIAILLARILQECGEFTHRQLFEQIKLDDIPLVRHDRAQLEFMLSLARKGETDESIAEVVAMVGSRYKLLYSEAQLMYLAQLAESGVPDEDTAEMVRRVKGSKQSIYKAARVARG